MDDTRLTNVVAPRRERLAAEAAGADLDGMTVAQLTELADTMQLTVEGTGADGNVLRKNLTDAIGVARSGLGASPAAAPTLTAGVGDNPVPPTNTA